MSDLDMLKKRVEDLEQELKKVQENAQNQKTMQEISLNEKSLILQQQQEAKQIYEPAIKKKLEDSTPVNSVPPWFEPGRIRKNWPRARMFN